MANDNERNDVSLCFQALGIEFGAPPEEVEKAYQRLLAEINKKQTSSNPTARAEAAQDLELARDLYEKIRNSVTYNTKLREAEQIAARKPQKQHKEAAQQFKICPACNKTISIALKKCPYCRELILTPFEKFVNGLFSLKIVGIVVILLALSAGVAYLVNPNLFKKSPPEPTQQISTGGFSNLSSGIFTNLTGSSKKP